MSHLKPVYRKTFLQISTFFSLFFIAFQLNAQKDFASLGSLEISDKQYWDMTTDEAGRLSVIYGSRERRNFRLYNASGELTYAHVLKEGYGSIVPGPYAHLADDEKLIYFFPPRENKYDLERIVVYKNEDKATAEQIRLSKKKIRILVAFTLEQSMVCITQDKKTKGLGYFRVYKDGQTEEGELKPDQAVVADLLRSGKHYQEVKSGQSLEPEQLISANKVYPQDERNIYVTLDPDNEEDRGRIELLKIDLEAKTISYKRLLNEHTTNKWAVRSFVFGKRLFRLVVEPRMFDLAVFSLEDLTPEKQFHYEPEGTFDLNNSKVLRTGSVDFFGFDKLDETVKNTGDILKYIARGRPILSVEQKENGLIAVKPGSLLDKSKNNTTFGVFSLTNGGNTICFGVPMRTAPATKRLTITKFVTLLNPNDLSKSTESFNFPRSDAQIRQYVRLNKRELTSLFTYQYKENKRLLALENIKTGEVKLVAFGGF